MAFDYTIVRSNRRTIAVQVSSDNKITVRCPHSMNDREVEAFINSKADWICGVVAENIIKRADNESILNYREILIYGKRCRLVFGGRNKIEDTIVYAKEVTSIKKILLKNFSAELIAFAERVSQQVGLSATSFSVRSYKARWGCCDRKGAITLNCLLVMLPLYLQRYVIIHELCHTVHFNHSRQFWNLVEKFEPEYKFCLKNLKNFNYLTKIY